METRVNLQVTHLDKILAAHPASVVLQLLKVRLDVNLHVRARLEGLLADGARHTVVLSMLHSVVDVQVILRRE